MVHTQISAAEPVLDVENVERMLSPDGVRSANGLLDPWVEDLTDADMRAMLRDMILVRRLDAEGVALQRQGQLALWAPCLGQEAAQVGTAHALRSDDFVFPSYREIGVCFVRGAKPVDFISAWRGEQHSTFNPYDLKVAAPQIIIGAQTLHAVGYAMGIQRDSAAAAGSGEVAVTYFGDGASSQGDVNEAMVFASSFTAPVVFVCQNNQWAISEPVSVQSRFPIAGRAPGFGIPSLRVDGNDALACVAAMRWALDHARRGEGPAFLELVTYRMGPHTTADDPSRYRDPEQLEYWRGRDPIARLEGHLRGRGALDDEFMGEVSAAADAFAAEVRSVCIGHASRPPMAVFDDVYAEPHAGLEREKRAFGAYLDGFEGDES